MRAESARRGAGRAKPAGRVRLSGGRHRGRLVSVPAGSRPTEGRVREALFSIWQQRLPGSRFLDLFAGSGAVGLEAAGRGAAEVVSVEAAARAARILEENRSRLGEEAVSVRRGQLPGSLKGPGSLDLGSFDLVFADPPYDFEGYGGLLEAITPHLTSGGEVAVEHARRVELPEGVSGLARTALRVYGETALSFYAPPGTSGEEP